MADLTLTRKISILAFLSKSEEYVTNSTLTDFFVGAGISDYFTLQQCIHDLADADLIDVQTMVSRTSYRINDEGAKTLHLYSSKLSGDILRDIDAYYKVHSSDLSLELIPISDYLPNPMGGFQCRLGVLENNRTIVNIELQVYSEEQAQTICANWKSHHEDAYNTLMETLMSSD